MTPSMEFCVLIEPHNGASYLDQLRVAQHAEELGFRGFFRADHLVNGDGEGLGLPGPTDTWMTLAAIGRETSTIRLGSLMTSATFRHPSLLTVMVAQADEMSGGRIEFGFGAGWWEYEHRATGIPLFEPAERFDRFEEQLEVITGLWNTPIGETFSHRGTHYTLDGSPALPKPVQHGGIPIIVGGDGKRRTPAIAARWAREYNSGWDDPDTTRTSFDRVDAACVAIGRDPRTLRHSTVQTLDAELSGRVGDYAAVGVQRLYVELLDLSDLDELTRFADAVSLAAR